MEVSIFARMPHIKYIRLLPYVEVTSHLKLRALKSPFIKIGVRIELTKYY